jgi:hypothetical protein
MSARHLITALAIAAALTATGRAQLIQSGSFSFSGTNFLSSTIAFDPWTNPVSELTSVTLQINGFVSGSIIFSGASYTVDSPQLFQSFSFTSGNTNGVPPNSIFTTSPLQTFPTAPMTPGTFSGVQPFTISPTTQISLAGSYDLTGNKQYFANLIGTNKIILDIASLMFVNSTGTPVGNNLNVSGSVTLAMVPEPSTWALLGLGAAAMALALRRRLTSPLL